MFKYFLAIFFSFISIASINGMPTGQMMDYSTPMMEMETNSPRPFPTMESATGMMPSEEETTLMGDESTMGPTKVRHMGTFGPMTTMEPMTKMYPTSFKPSEESMTGPMGMSTMGPMEMRRTGNTGPAWKQVPKGSTTDSMGMGGRTSPMPSEESTMRMPSPTTSY